MSLFTNTSSTEFMGGETHVSIGYFCLEFYVRLKILAFLE